MGRNRFTLAELLTQNPFRYVGVQFTCRAAVTTIDESKGWFYKACSQCRKKLLRRGDTLACEDHEFKEPKDLYFFATTISDGTAEVKATFFNDSGTSLLKVDCRAMTYQHGYASPHVLPLPLETVRGMTKIFQMHFSLSSKPGAIEFLVDSVFEDVEDP